MILSPSLIWFLVGVAFLIAELIMPAFILIFFTVGCWIAALVVWAIDIELTKQILVFLVSSLFLLFILRKYSLKIFRGKTQDEIDDHYSDSKIGKTAIVTKKITPNKFGEIKVMGSFWRATANDEIEEGSSVLIEEKESEDGLTLRVKPV
ncbi:MAG: NfeD family protein [Deltaproteobacteria bacterium]|nr:NfeD family protein [Deltaproteobacteria bacterium]MBW1863423.1 NfeD family protein [Deltaproteobacteria bacterium]